MDASRAIKLAHLLYEDVSGYEISRAGKAAAGLTDDKAFTYGEIALETFPAILEMSRSRGGVFYDLGCGVGKAVIMAALLGRWHKTVGIELVPDLFNAAQKIHGRFDRIITPLMSKEEPVPQLDFIKGDIWQTDWSDADCVFFQGTCFASDQLKTLATRCEELKPGSKIIVASSLLPSTTLALRDHAKFRLGWGEATIFFYEKIG